MIDYDDVFSGAADESPMAGGACGTDEQEGIYSYDEHGLLRDFEASATVSGARNITGPFPFKIPFRFACSTTTLNGSWLLEFRPRFGFIFGTLRGPMRLESAGGVLRASGDMYHERPSFSAFPTLPRRVRPVAPVSTTVFPGPFRIRRNWYPAFPQRQYRWYFRSTNVRYDRRVGYGTLRMDVQRHVWSVGSQDFVSEDSGWMRFNCSQTLIFRIPGFRTTVQMTGTASIGGQLYQVTATKTSPHYRGCLVEVDVMQNRSWPGNVQDCAGTTMSFDSIYRDNGLDFRVVVNETNIPQDNQLSNAELHTLLANRSDLRPSNDAWYFWLLVGSGDAAGNLGIMFDFNNAPHREGAVGFSDPVLGSSTTILASARNQALGNVPDAFLRTLVHEAGHGFNLLHPKGDTHNPGVGTTIMNQTGDVMGFATVADPYPCNATFDFNEHNRTSLIHAPDPQVKPGWKEFGYGHTSSSPGLPAPADALGLDPGDEQDSEVRLTLEAPEKATLGEVVLVTATLTNHGSAPRFVSPALNLSETDLSVHVARAGEEGREFRDIVYACADGRLVELAPGASISGTFQLSYTNRGHPFDRPGTYGVSAEMELGQGTMAHATATIEVGEATSSNEAKVAELMLDEGVGMSLAFGDVRDDEHAEKCLEELAAIAGDSLTGAAASLVLANSYDRGFRDLATGKVMRKAQKARASEAVKRAAKALDTVQLAKLAVAVVSATDKNAPLIKSIPATLKGRGKAAAQQIFADHLA